MSSFRRGHAPAPALVAVLSSLAALACAACSTTQADADPQTAEQESVADATSITARGDGTFDVVCKDGSREVATVADITGDRICKPAVAPVSPFQANACTGAPMTEADARARLAAAPSVPATIGTFRVAFRTRHASYEWDAMWRRNMLVYRWQDAPRAAFVAFRETGYSETTGVRATFAATGAVELAAGDDGAPYLRLVGEAANELGPDTTRFLRLVSDPIRPWRGQTGPSFALEQRVGDAAWTKVTDWGHDVRIGQGGASRQSWHFGGAGTTSFVTDACGQYVSAQSTSTMSPTADAIGLYMKLR